MGRLWRWLQWLLGLGFVGFLLTTVFQYRLALTDSQMRQEDAERRLAVAEDQVTTLRRDLDDLRSRSVLFSLLSPDTWQFQIVDLSRAEKLAMSFGDCPSPHCLTFAINEFTKQNDVPSIVWHVTGSWAPFMALSGPLVSTMPLVKGCRMRLRTAAIDISVIIMDDSYSKGRLAFAASGGTAQPGKASFEFAKCAE
jgi:hypothetical protein